MRDYPALTDELDEVYKSPLLCGEFHIFQTNRFGNVGGEPQSTENIEVVIAGLLLKGYPRHPQYLR